MRRFIEVLNTRNPVLVLVLNILLIMDMLYSPAFATEAQTYPFFSRAVFEGDPNVFPSHGNNIPNGNIFAPVPGHWELRPLTLITNQEEDEISYVPAQGHWQENPPSQPARSRSYFSLRQGNTGFTLPSLQKNAGDTGFTLPSLRKITVPTTVPSTTVKYTKEIERDLDVAASNNYYDERRDRPGADCELSITRVNEKRVCRSSIIFSDNFQTFDDSKWTKEQFIPSYSSDDEMIFNYFDKKNVDVVNNVLEITPNITDDEFVRRGSLKLDDCTGTTPEECDKKSQYQWILPPASSGRITTKNSFCFKYGYVEITAKVPKGDWLMPELWLVPKQSKYGPGLESGKMVMVMARGNRELEHEGTDLGYKVLESSLLMSSEGKIRSRTLRVKSEEPWHFHYNKYLFTWRPDEITVSVNGIVIGNLVFKNITGTLANLIGFSHADEKKWFKGSAMAPFDEEFYLSIGLSVGGRYFPDNSVSRHYTKPWKSRTVKEMLDFWRAKDKWAPTWIDNDPKFKILKVKVKAL